jgi:hypothetical protein
MSVLKGNFNNKGVVDAADSQYILNWLNGGGNFTKYNQIIEYNGNEYIISDNKVLMDTNGDGVIDASDAQYLSNWLNGGGNFTKIGQYIPYNGNQYIIDYIGDQTHWNTFNQELLNSKYRFFIEIYNIPLGTQSIISNIKSNDGLIIKNSDVEEGKISSKSNYRDTSGLFTKFNTTQDVRLSTDSNDLFKNIIINDDTFYHKSLSVPMKSSFTRLKEIIIYIFFQGNAYNIPSNNTGVMATLNLDSLGISNLSIHNNETVVLDHHRKLIYHRNSANQVNTIDLTSIVSDGILFS